MEPYFKKNAPISSWNRPAVVSIINVSYNGFGKYPKILNTLFHTFLAWNLLFLYKCFLKYIVEWQTM